MKEHHHTDHEVNDGAPAPTSHAANGGMHDGHNPAHGMAGHDHHAMMIADFRTRFWISLVLTVPVLVLSPMVQEFLGLSISFPGSHSTIQKRFNNLKIYDFCDNYNVFIIDIF